MHPHPHQPELILPYDRKKRLLLCVLCGPHFHAVGYGQSEATKVLGAWVRVLMGDGTFPLLTLTHNNHSTLISSTNKLPVIFQTMHNANPKQTNVCSMYSYLHGPCMTKINQKEWNWPPNIKIKSLYNSVRNA